MCKLLIVKERDYLYRYIMPTYKDNRMVYVRSKIHFLLSARLLMTPLLSLSLRTPNSS